MSEHACFEGLGLSSEWAEEPDVGVSALDEVAYRSEAGGDLGRVHARLVASAIDAHHVDTVRAFIRRVAGGDTQTIGVEMPGQKNQVRRAAIVLAEHDRRAHSRGDVAPR